MCSQSPQLVVSDPLSSSLLLGAQRPELVAAACSFARSSMCIRGCAASAVGSRFAFRFRSIMPSAFIAWSKFGVVRLVACSNSSRDIFLIWRLVSVGRPWCWRTQVSTITASSAVKPKSAATRARSAMYLFLSEVSQPSRSSG